MNQSALNKEIEAKFLVSELPDQWDSHPHSVLQQGYVLTSPEHSLRLRQKANRYIQTVKIGQGLSRTEVEFDLAESQFNRLWPLTHGKRLSKKRYRIPLPGGLVAELDIYTGQLEGLMTVEVEFSSEQAYNDFIRSSVPAWFGKEVTNDSRYLNQTLAIAGLPL